MVVCEQHPRGVAGVGVLETFGPAFGVEFEGHGWFFCSRDDWMVYFSWPTNLVGEENYRFAFELSLIHI